ncbi:phage tail assembly protein [Serratia ureilytica]|uniref:Phage tail assembly protein n=1 Tax=Serratia ureilytica TaxID=300181 RepID=A0A9X9G1N0_9GAMM|nr:phage tail assembly protein [Serratia ureilytica]TXE26939.1 phage tail assembly protein [Serratia ureilytica]
MSKEKEPQAAAESANPNVKSVTLDTPIKRGDMTIDTITLRKPDSGELRGVKLQALMETDVDSLIRVLPRITMPSLTQSEIQKLDPADLYSLAAEVTLFLLPKSVLSDIPQN